MIYTFFYLFILPFFLSASIVYFWQFLLRKKEIFDHPNHRSSHDLPTPRGGGIGIFLGFWISTIVFYLVFGLNNSDSLFSLTEYTPQKNGSISLLLFALASGILFLAGLWDDFSSTRRRIRLSIQILVALILIFNFKSNLQLTIDSWFLSVNAEMLIFKFQYLIYGIVSLALIVGIVWTINLYNFMDGINGIAGLQSIFLLASISFFIYKSNPNLVVLPLLIILSGSTLGFLIWNFPKAFVFLGDGGSNFLGFMIVAFGLLSVMEGILSIWSGLVLSSLFWMDATVTIFLRWMRKENIVEAHRCHLYQILSQRWKSHSIVSLLYLFINLFLLFPLAVFMGNQPQWEIPIFSFVLIVFLIFYTQLISSDSNYTKFNSNL